MITTRPRTRAATSSAAIEGIVCGFVPHPLYNPDFAFWLFAALKKHVNGIDLTFE
jgi:hypothetical protein